MKCQHNLVIGLCLMALTLGAVVVAQNDSDGMPIYEGYTGEVLTFHDPDPMEVEGMVATDGNLESVTAASDNWYGQIVTLEGEIGDFVNARIFSLGEGAALDNDQVLIVNNSTFALPPEVMQGAHVRVTGRVFPSLTAVEDGAQTDFGVLFNSDNTQMDTSETGAMSDVSTQFDRFYSAWNGIGMTATDDTVTDFQALDTNLETLTEEQRIQLADAFEQDASEFEADHPTLSQTLRDTATGLRNNDVDATRTGLQSSVTELQNAQNMQAMNPTPSTMEGSTAMTTMNVSRPDMVEWVYEGLVPDNFDNFTILEIFSVENVSFVDFGANDIGQ